jgi:hypothetical protein
MKAPITEVIDIVDISVLLANSISIIAVKNIYSTILAWVAEVAV